MIPVRLIHQTTTDEDLVLQLAEGRCEALALLHARHAKLLINLASRRLGHSTAEEVVQDVFMVVWQHARSFDPQRGSFRPWVFQIARWRIINELRRRRSRPQVDPGEASLDRLADDDPEPAELMAREERRMAVRCALDVLAPPQRQAVTLAFFRDLTHQEVAVTLQLPLGTIKTRIRSGLLNMREPLMSGLPRASERNPDTHGRCTTDPGP
jgi:RNA polymerase sigma-70 factor, ECF subfamily